MKHSSWHSRGIPSPTFFYTVVLEKSWKPWGNPWPRQTGITSAVLILSLCHHLIPPAHFFIPAGPPWTDHCLETDCANARALQLVRALSSVLKNKASLSPVPMSVAIAIPGINHGFRDIWNAGKAGGRTSLWLPFGASGMSVHACAALWLVSWLWVYSSKWLWVRKRMSFKNHELLEESLPVTQMFLSL